MSVIPVPPWMVIGLLLLWFLVFWGPFIYGMIRAKDADEKPNE